MKKVNLLKYFGFLILFVVAHSVFAQSNNLIYKKEMRGRTSWFKSLNDGSGYAVTYTQIYNLDSLDIGVWQQDPVSVTIDSTNYTACLVLYNTNFEPLGKVFSKTTLLNPYPLTNTEAILTYHNYNPSGSILPIFPSPSNFTGGSVSEGMYLRYNSLDQSVNRIFDLGLPSAIFVNNNFAFPEFFTSVYGNYNPLNIGSIFGNSLAILNNNVLIGYYQLFDQQSINDSLEFSAWGGQVNLIRIKMNLNSGEIGADQIGSSTGSLIPLCVQATNDGEGLYYAGVVRGNNTPVSVSGAELEMASEDSLFHVYITKESVEGDTEWLTQLYAYNNILPDTGNHNFMLSNNVYKILEKAENLYVNSNIYGIISIDDTLIYRDFTGENLLLTDVIPYYGVFSDAQIPIAKNAIYKMNSDGNLIGKLSYTQGLVGYYQTDMTGWINETGRLFDVADNLAWVHSYYSATDTSLVFTYKSVDGNTQNSAIDLPAGKGTFIVWLDTDLNILDYWLFPYTSDYIAKVSNINNISQYLGDTLLIQGSISPLTAININPFGPAAIVESTESTETKSYFGFYAAPEILTNTPRIEELPNLSIYPNPTQDELHISGIETENGRYRIFDISGRLMQAGNLKSDFVIQTSGLTSGMYILRINTEKHGGSRKFVVK